MPPGYLLTRNSSLCKDKQRGHDTSIHSKKKKLCQCGDDGHGYPSYMYSQSGCSVAVIGMSRVKSLYKLRV